MNAYALCACGKALPIRRQKCDECRIEARRLSWRISAYKKSGRAWTLEDLAIDKRLMSWRDGQA